MRKALNLALLAALLHAAAAGQSKTGTTIGQFTLIEPSARSAAMGGTGVTSVQEGLAAYYNVAALGMLERSDLQFTYNLWFADIAVNNAVAAFRLGGAGTVAAFVTHLSSGDIDVRTVEQPLGTGERYQVTDLLLGVGYGIRITDRFACGIQASFIQERIWHSSATFFGVNIGTLYQLTDDGLMIGASLANFGTKDHFTGTDVRVRYDFDPDRYGDNSSIPADIITDDYSLPIVFRVGFGYPVTIDGSSTLRLAIDGLSPSDNSPAVHLGAEWVFKRVLALRAGYSSLFQEDSEFGLTLGAGLAWDGLGSELRVDYGWGDHRRLGGVQRITLGLGL